MGVELGRARGLSRQGLKVEMTQALNQRLHGDNDDAAWSVMPESAGDGDKDGRRLVCFG